MSVVAVGRGNIGSVVVYCWLNSLQRFIFDSHSRCHFLAVRCLLALCSVLRTFNIYNNGVLFFEFLSWIKFILNIQHFSASVFTQRFTDEQAPKVSRGEIFGFFSNSTDVSFFFFEEKWITYKNFKFFNWSEKFYCELKLHKDYEDCDDDDGNYVKKKQVEKNMNVNDDNW